MLKMFQFAKVSADSPAFWEENWGEVSHEEGIRYCGVDPLRTLFERHVPRGSRMLEGGCGLGQYVAYYAGNGREVVGLDFDRKTLARLQQIRSDLVLCSGDVAALPFRSGSFDAYYSGGVVEHFEGGPEPALREARRVLRRSGTLLVSVPYFSPLRRGLSPFRRRLWIRMPEARLEPSTGTGDRRFWQYAYTPKEFTRILAHAGFRVVSRQAFSILWGLYDLPMVGRLVGRLKTHPPARPSVPSAVPEPRKTPVPSSGSLRHLAKRLLVSEDATVPVAGELVRLLRASCANMMMYVCEPASGEGGE